MGLDLDRFLEELPEYLRCPVCLGAATDPRFVCQHQHVLCAPCFEAVNAVASPTCPQCRFPIKAVEAHYAQRVLETYRVVCERKAAGCVWTGSVSEEENHRTKQCPYRLVTCPECHARLPARLLKNHLAETCLEAFVTCKRGGKDCGGWVGSGELKRKDSAYHAERCTEFSCKHGCGTRTTRRNLEGHEVVCRQQQESKQALQEELRKLKEKYSQRSKAADELRLCLEATRFPPSSPSKAGPSGSVSLGRRLPPFPPASPLTCGFLPGPPIKFVNARRTTGCSEDDEGDGGEDGTPSSAIPPAKKKRT
ncbi:hypothetical protein JCM6882_009392 [Rhodosporidiobolus microsporus]